tara:strand:- start:3568 stop:3858 length:291 start_codon:yes stop_codon:yes gene_type:complete
MTVTILDMFGRELKPGTPVIFTLQSDLDKGTLAKFSGIVAHIYVWDERRITKLKIAPTSNWRFRNADTFVTRRLISMFGEFDNNIEEDKLDILEVQ